MDNEPTDFDLHEGWEISPHPEHLTLRSISPPDFAYPVESARAEIQVLPVDSTDLVFSVAPGDGLEVPDRWVETRPRPRYEKTDSEGTPTDENSPDPRKRSLPTPNETMPPGGPQPNRRSGSDLR